MLKEGWVFRIAAVTQMEPMNARKMVPCFDEPSYKANWTVTVMHPKGTKAISNGIESENSTESVHTANDLKEFSLNDDFLVSHFETTPKMSSYLLAIFISEFDFNEGKTASGIRVRLVNHPLLSIHPVPYLVQARSQEHDYLCFESRGQVHRVL